MNTRQPAFCGMFYPEHSHDLERDIAALLSEAEQANLIPRALIAPHAGYMYSGAIAASAYRCLENVTTPIKRVVLLGPSHRVAFKGVATPGCDSFLTPLGNVLLDKSLIARIEQHPQVQSLPKAHAEEHSLEVHLPFLQKILTDFTLVPLVVGDIDAQTMASIIDTLCQDDSTFLIVSSDLSHFLSYAEAQERDKDTSEQIVNLRPQLVGEQACGCRPLNGLLQYCKARHLNITNIDLRNSGDTAGSRDSVVGYGAYVVH